jgi:hypothetical protein
MSETMGYNPGQEFSKPKTEKDEITPARAGYIFENAVINAINDELEPGGQIISSDGAVNLKWLVDEETPEGRFQIIKRRVQKTPIQETTKEYIWEEDTETGKKYQVEKMSGPFKSQDETAVVYDLDTNKVREIFNKLEPAVKESFINGWKESLKENINQVNKLKAKLEIEKRHKEREELEMQIVEYESAQEKIKKELKALA